MTEEVSEVGRRVDEVVGKVEGWSLRIEGIERALSERVDRVMGEGRKRMDELDASIKEIEY